ncbi:MAG: type I polyketide synthase, partial [Acidimicrobiia bacterium]|nr:type I polyketide synthase [Acidimicrobiia bacterium]
MLSPSGTCKSFDQSGDGYVRADGVGVIVVTRSDLAKRTYATIVGSKTNNDGYTSQGITFPSGQAQVQLLRDVYREAGIDPQHVSYVEAHGTGTRAGDPQEVGAIAEVFQPAARGRDNPLLLGSVKSNAGHAEGAAALLGVIKVLLSMKNGVLPANLHFKEPNRDIPALHDGSVRVVTENMPWTGGLVGINSFGFGGTNAHLILAGGESVQGRATGKVTSPTFLPVAGRTRDSVTQLLDGLRADELSTESVEFLQSIANTDAFGFRGGVVVEANGLGSALVAERPSAKPPLYFAFPGMGSQWPKMAADLLTLPIFRASFDACAEVLNRLESPLDLHALISSDDATAFASPTHAFVGITAVQLSMVDLFRAHGVDADGFVGHSVGEIACGYADGGLTREQAVLAAYHRGRSVEDEPRTHGKMAVVERTWLDAQSLASDEVTVACHNAPENVTLSGSTTAIDALVSRLAALGEQATVVNSSGIAFHSRQVRAAAPALRAALEKLIPAPKPRSARWLSTSRNADEAGEDLCTAEYFVDNLTRPVRFAEALQQLPRGAMVIEMGPHSLLHSAVIGSVEDCTYAHAMRRDYDNRVEVLNALGTCWLHNIEIDWRGGDTADSRHQGSAGTREQILRVPFLGAWDHSSEWPLADLSRDVLRQTGHLDFSYEIDLKSEAYAFIADHKINGHVLFPAVGYLWLVWRTLARIKNVGIDQLPIEFLDVRFMRATMLSEEHTTELKVSYLPVGGRFEVVEGDDVVATGNVHTGDDVAIGPAPMGSTEDVPLMTGDDLYKETRLRGYQYGETFRGVQSVSLDGQHVEVRWDGNWVTFFDSLVQASLVREKRHLFVPTGLRRGAIDPRRQPAPTVIHGTGSLSRRRIVTNAVEFEGFDLATLLVGDRAEKPFLAAQRFVPYVENDILERRGETFVRDYVDITLHYITRQVALLAERCAVEGRVVPQHAVKVIKQLAPLPHSACDPDPARVQEFAAHPNAVMLRLAQATFSQPEELLTDALPLIVAFEEYGRVYRDDIGTINLFDQRDLGG